MQKIVGAVALCLMLVGSSVMAAPVGVVDYQKVAQAISFQKVMSLRMQQATTDSTKSIADISAKITAKEKELKDKVATLKAELKKRLEGEVETQRQALAKLQAEMQTKMMTLRQKLADEIKGKLEQTIGAVAAKHNIETVYTSMGLAYAANKVDLTDEIIAELAKTYGRNEEDAEPLKTKLKNRFGTQN